MSIVNEYLSQIYNVVGFILSRQNLQTHKNVILLDSVKCIIVGTTLGCLLRFARGECHFQRYMNSMVFGSLFGASYSFNLTNKRVEYFQALSKMRFQKMAKQIKFQNMTHNLL